MMENKTYEERHQRIACELACAVSGMVEFLHHGKTATQHMEQAAHIVLKHRAEAFTNAYMSFFLLTGGDEDGERYDTFRSNCQHELIQRGLIPSPENKEG